MNDDDGAHDEPRNFNAADGDCTIRPAPTRGDGNAAVIDVVDTAVAVAVVIGERGTDGDCITEKSTAADVDRAR